MKAQSAWKIFLYVNVLWFCWSIFLVWQAGTRVFCGESLFCDVSGEAISLDTMAQRAAFTFAAQLFLSSVITYLIVRERRKLSTRDH